MLPHKPEDWPRGFTQHLNAGDLDAVVSLYEPDARFVPLSGDTVAGRDGVRRMLGELIRTKTRLHGRVVKVLTVDNVAMLYTDFQGSTVDSSGRTVEIAHKAIEVLRRQADGTWKLIFGDPNGRGDRSRADRETTQRQDELLDEALEETFPASDPIAPARIRQGTTE